MSKGFGLLVNLTDLNMFYCTSISSLPESETHVVASFIFLFSHFGNMMSKGFGLLVNLTDLNMGYCGSVTSLPESESPYS